MFMIKITMEEPTNTPEETNPEPGKLPDRPEFESVPEPKKGKHRLLIVAILVVVLLLVVVGSALAYFHLKTPVKAANTANTQQTAISAPYAGWKTYTSPREKASFKYPSNWTISKPYMVSNDVNNTDQIGIKSPSGAITISYVTTLVGFGDEHTDNYPLNEIIDKSPITGAPGLSVVSGITTLDSKTYYPWIAVQDSSGITKSGVMGNVVTFTSHWAVDPPTNNFTGILFSTSAARTNQNSPALTKAQAGAWFNGSEAKQAKEIMAGLVDPANPAANWLLYVSPGAHYSVRLPDGWNLTQNCDNPWSELETYYNGNNDPLALKTGTKAVVDHNCFGKDGNPTISFQWYDFSSATQDAQKLLDSFSTDKNIQKQGTFLTDSGQTVDKYYMKVTTPQQNISQPQQGTYYEYIIKNKTGFVWVFNFYFDSNPTVVDRHDVVESAIKTLVLN